MKVIMISGKSYSGKDTVSKMIQHDLYLKDKKVLVIHFGDLVKDYLTKYYGWNGEKDIWGRARLQKLGTAQVRGSFPDYWAEVVGKFIAAVAQDWDYVLIPDWRFKNEFETICKYNSDVIALRINRRNQFGKYVFNPEMTKEQIWHESEIELDDFNFNWIIENCSTLEELRNSVKIMLDNII